MIQIYCETGSEWHSSWGAYGRIKVRQVDGRMVHHFTLPECETDWDEVTLVGSQGKHGKWIPAYLTVAEGALLYLEGASTYKGKPSKKGRGWFKARGAAPKISITTPGYNDRGLYVEGNLEQVPYEVQVNLGLDPRIRNSKYLQVEEQKSGQD